MELAFQGCAPSTIRLDLKLNGKKLRGSQLVVGPAGLRLVRDPTRLPVTRLGAFASRRPPPVLQTDTPRVHLWLGSSWAGGLDLYGGASNPAAKLADKMLQDAGYSKGPSKPK
jgi:hypothetical protein